LKLRDYKEHKTEKLPLIDNYYVKPCGEGRVPSKLIGGIHLRSPAVFSGGELQKQFCQTATFPTGQYVCFCKVVSKELI